MKRILVIFLIVFVVAGCEKKEPKANLEEIFPDPPVNGIPGNETTFNALGW